jgi:hypothetical protein
MPQAFRRVYGGRGGGGYSVADKQRDDDKGPLNEREREILEELERQMGSEVGITSSDPEEARRRENDKARVDLWRIIAFLNIALLAGIGATVGFLVRPLPSSNYLLVVSVAFNLSGLLLAFFALALASGAVGAEADEDPEYVASLRRWRERVGVVAYTGFGLSVLTFLVFVGNNLNALRP